VYKGVINEEREAYEMAKSLEKVNVIDVELDLTENRTVVVSGGGQGLVFTVNRHNDEKIVEFGEGFYMEWKDVCLACLAYKNKSEQQQRG